MGTLFLGILLLAHGALGLSKSPFPKIGWVDGLVEVILAGVLLRHWWLRGKLPRT